MITYVQGDLFTSPARVLVNAVNTVGVMGKGIAAQFKKIYPDMFAAYRQYCETKQLTIGKLYLHKTPHKYILNFPTKRHWRHPSQPTYIERGLSTFARTYASKGITSVAFPALGCGNGELDYDTQVRPLMDTYLSPLPIPAFVYSPRAPVRTPEHRDPRKIKRWLRSTPSALPFDEVWEDLSVILARHSWFSTIPNGVRYHATIPELSSGHPSIRVSVGTRHYNFDTDTLLDFWQQLRDYGFMHRSIAPHHYRVSYLMPIFAHLPYVEYVTVSDSPGGLRRHPAVALQVIPPPRQEMDLFSSNHYALAEV